MTVSRDIDSFWQQLNKRPDKKNKTNVKIVSNADPAELKPISYPQSPQVDHSDHYRLSLVPTSKDIGSAAGKDLSLDGLEQCIQRPLQMLKDPAAAVRLRGLQSMKAGHRLHPSLCMPMAAHPDAVLMLQALLFKTQLQASVMQEETEHLVAKPLLLCLGDKSEACREAAINMLVSLLQVQYSWPAVTSPTGRL